MKAPLYFAALAMAALLAGCAHGDFPASRAADMPSISPEGEVALATVTPLAAQCLAKVRQATEAAKGQLGPPLLTSNAKWGEVWRADVRYKDHGDLRASRAMCWRFAGEAEPQVILAPLVRRPLPILRPRVN